MEYREVTIETLCGLFGKSKQAYYKHKRQTVSDYDWEQEVLAVVAYYRELMPLLCQFT